ncbi:MAG: 6-bladed beta-propeller [Candidatus Aminicenantes bacterium]|nr:6-bladed beta-propeller [Candidatus Aminicenantes bacterium]
MKKQMCIALMALLFSVYFCRAAWGMEQQRAICVYEDMIIDGEGFDNYFPLPVEIKCDSQNICVLDAEDHAIKIFTKKGTYIKSIGQKGKGPGEFDMPSGLDLFDGRLYVADKMNRRIQVLDKDGIYLNGFITRFSPDDVAVLDKDCIVVSKLPLIGKSEVKMIFCFNSEGRLLWKQLDSFYSGERIYDVFRNRLDMGISEDGALMVVRKNNDRNVYWYNQTGSLINKVSLDKTYSFKDIVLPVRKKRTLSNLFSDMAVWKNRLYLLSSKYTKKGKKQDLLPGDQIHIFDINGNHLNRIDLPFAFKLISVDGQRILGIDSQQALRILNMVQQ